MNKARVAEAARGAQHFKKCRPELKIGNSIFNSEVLVSEPEIETVVGATLRN